MTPEELLPAETMARLERLQLATRRPLAGRFVGEQRSPRRGTSLDFADHREYHPGDDHRRIDHNLYARLDLLFIKLFEAEDDLTLRLLLDASASMGLHGKFDTARRVAAAVGFLALTRRDSVTVHTMPDLRTPVRFSGSPALPEFLDHLGGLTAAGPTPFAAAVADVLRRPGPPGMTMVISDVLTRDWDHALRRLPSRGGDLAVVQVLAPEDLAPSLVGDLDVVDVETAVRLSVSMSEDVRASYRDELARWIGDVGAGCRRLDAAHVLLTTDESLEDALMGTWRAAGVLA